MTTPRWRGLMVGRWLWVLPHTHLAVDCTWMMSHMSFYLVSLHRNWLAATSSFTVLDELVEWAKKVMLLYFTLLRLDGSFSKCAVHLRYRLCRIKCASLRSCCLPLLTWHLRIHRSCWQIHNYMIFKLILDQLAIRMANNRLKNYAKMM